MLCKYLYNTFYQAMTQSHQVSSRNHVDLRVQSLESLSVDAYQKISQENVSLTKQISEMKQKISQLETQDAEKELIQGKSVTEGAKLFTSTASTYQKDNKDMRERVEKDQQNMIKDIKDKIQNQIKEENAIEISELEKKVEELAIKNETLKNSKDQLERKGTKVLFRPEIQAENLFLLKRNLELNQQIVKFQTQQATNKKNTHDSFRSNIEKRMEKLDRMKTNENQDQKKKQAESSEALKEVIPKIGDLLKVVLKVKQLEGNCESQQLKTQINTLIQKISIPMRKPEDFIKLMDHSQLERSFGKIVDGISGEIKQRKEQLSLKTREAQDSNTLKKEIANKIHDLASKEKMIQNLKDAAKDKEIKAAQKNGQNEKVIQDCMANIQQELKKAKIADAQIKKLEREEQRLRNSVESLDRRVKSQERQLSTQNEDIKQLKSEIFTLKGSNSGLQRKLTSLQNVKNDLEKTSRAKTEEVKSLKEDNRRTQQDTRCLQEKNKRLQDDNDSIQMQKRQTEDRLKSKQTQNIDLNGRFLEKSNELKSARVQMEQMYEEMRQLRKIEEAFSSMNKKLLPELSFYMGKESKQFNSEEPQTSLKQTLGWFKSKYNQAKYFGDSEVIPREKVDFLLKEIKSFTSSYVIETKLLYRYDVRNTLKFHDFIDHKENMLIVIKLINNITIGGFSCYPLEKVDKEQAKKQGVGRGILFSLTNDKTFQMRKDARNLVMTYDDFFFIFGNSELRLRSQEKKFFSNFGVATSTFENAGFPRTEFLGVYDTAINELEIIGYEFYQIKLKL